jgi:hypothetical protein
MFLEVTDPQNPAHWSCFVSHRLSVVNQRSESERSMTKESQNRYSKTAKDWGWREFVTLTALFDQDSGFLVGDAVVFSAEVLVLKETSDLKVLPVEKRAVPALPSSSGTTGDAKAAVGSQGSGGDGEGRNHSRGIVRSPPELGIAHHQRNHRRQRAVLNMRPPR